ARAFAAAPFDGRQAWPRVSVVVCTYNGARTLDETLAAARRLDYPDYEIVVVSDGSTDASGDIALRHGVRLIETPNRGLSSARNTAVPPSRPTCASSAATAPPRPCSSASGPSATTPPATSPGRAASTAAASATAPAPAAAASTSASGAPPTSRPSTARPPASSPPSP